MKRIGLPLVKVGLAAAMAALVVGSLTQQRSGQGGENWGPPVTAAMVVSNWGPPVTAAMVHAVAKHP